MADLIWRKCASLSYCKIINPLVFQFARHIFRRLSMNQASHTFAGWGTRCFKFATLAVAALAFAAPEIASAQTWCTILEQAPNAAVVTDAAVRAKIVASGFPWLVRDNSSGIEMLLIPGGTFTMGCSASNSYVCNGDENPPHQVTLS